MVQRFIACLVLKFELQRGEGENKTLSKQNTQPLTQEIPAAMCTQHSRGSFAIERTKRISWITPMRERDVNVNDIHLSYFRRKKQKVNSGTGRL